MSIPDFDFGSLENEIQSDHMRSQMNSVRSAVRLACQLAAGIEADAREAGLSRDVARALSLSYLESVTGLTLRVGR